MSYTIHLVSHVAPGPSGGLEAWTVRFARRLLRQGHSIVVYISSDEPYQPDAPDSFDVVPLASLRAVWEAPIDSPVWTERFVKERARLDFLVLRNEIRRRMTRDPGKTHLVVSNYAITAGFLAATVARDIGLPHIAMFVGTDFSRGFRNMRERPLIEHVCRTATGIIVKNTEQERALRDAFAPSFIARIPTSIEMPPPVTWSSGSRSQVTLLSDCGFSYKKGTGVLLDSLEALVTEGLPVRLVLFGGIESDQLKYWTRRRREAEERLPASVSFPGEVPRQRIYAAFASADVFCSATLGEGSSSGRIAAMCAGLPLVTTRCGEMATEAEGIAHVYLADAADAAGFARKLRTMVEDILRGRLRVDDQAVGWWRERYSEEREIADWSALLDRVAGTAQP